MADGKRVAGTIRHVSIITVKRAAYLASHTAELAGECGNILLLTRIRFKNQHEDKVEDISFKGRALKRKAADHG